MANYISQHKKNFNFKTFVQNALQEDVGDGDHSALATIPANKKGKCHLLVKENGILAGVEAAKEIFKIIDPKFKVTTFIQDGTPVKVGDIAFVVEGSSQKLLTAERLVLNVMQRMSGIATKTNYLQSLCKGTKTKVIDTRKTTPGFRFFEKWAVVIGGGSNHRFGLYDMIMLKDNHIDFCGGILEALDATHTYLKKTKKKLPIEVETRTLNDVKLILEKGGFQRIMLDNYSIADTKKAVALIGNKYEIESSGGITEKTIANYAKCGVDFISVGALTHHVKSLDLSLKAIK
ncbi:MAG TPA: carboxylating nicotinate-nucleotide diphosphorylase [Bacteroidia bacterium]|nr:carboxylating nicotinate-nucleotide diphosphorylase [Bacteroidia bacterium]